MRFKSVAEFLSLTGSDATTAERDLIKAAQEGRPCFLCDPAKPTLPASASDKTRIRADLLRLLITGGTPDCGLQERGVTLIGGWIEGRLDLAYCTARGQTLLNHCQFPLEPRLEGARFQLLSLDKGQLSDGLYAQGVLVQGSLFLSNLSATGTFDVAGAQIGGQLDCHGSAFDGIGTKALNAQGVTTGQDLFLSKLIAVGTVDVSGAQIMGQLSCMGARFDGKGRMALNAQGVTTGQDLFLSSLTATGTVDMNGAQIGGQFDCDGASLDGNGDMALNAKRARVMEGFYFRKLKQVSGQIDLTAARVGDLVDDLASWPLQENNLILDGFTYDRIEGPTTLEARRDWLRAGSHWHGELRPQPYTQLARVLRQMGLPGEARRVAREAVREASRASRDVQVAAIRLSYGLGGFGFLAESLLQIQRVITELRLAVFGFVYNPIKSSVISTILLATISALLAQFAWKDGSFAPNSDVILASPGWAEVTARDCFPENAGVCDPNPAQTWADTFSASGTMPTQGADWDSFNALGYAADLVVPFLDLGQTDAWAPSKDRGYWGWVLWWARWVLATLGWIVTGLGVAAVTGVMQRNQPD